MSTPDEKIKHLEFIRDVITRLNSNSFQIKSWAVTIVAALLAVYASTNIELLILVGLVPVLVFWFLDSYYLWKEKKFRALYKDVAGLTQCREEIGEFDMSTSGYEEGILNYLAVFRSKTISLLYFPLAALLVGAYIYLTKCVAQQ